MVSLTSELDRKAAPLRVWFDATFPCIKAVQPPGRWKIPLATPSTGPGNWRGRVGTAFDDRARWWWPWTPAEDLLGVRIAPLVIGDRSAAALASYLNGPIAGLASSNEMSESDEEQLARAALVVSQLETVFRSRMPPDPTTTGLREGATVATLLAAQDAAAVVDLVTLARSSRPSLAPGFGRPAVLNPTFAWSLRVGGADADLIVDHCLVELKATSDKGLLGEVVRQLIGYLLLDYEDRYQIDRVAVFYARRPQLLEWPADTFLNLCAGRPTARGQLRDELDTILPLDGRGDLADPNQLELFD